MKKIYLNIFKGSLLKMDEKCFTGGLGGGAVRKLPHISTNVLLGEGHLELVSEQPPGKHLPQCTDRPKSSHGDPVSGGTLSQRGHSTWQRLLSTTTVCPQHNWEGILSTSCI